MQTVCHICQAEPKKPTTRLPNGWKRFRDNVYCRTCWRERYILRAVTVPVVGRAHSDPGDWPGLRESLKAAWIQSTAVANLVMTECYVRDVSRMPGQDKMPGMPRVYLYPEIRTQFPALPPRSVASIEQSVQRKYRSVRYAVKWLRSESLPTFRYPFPYPMHNQGWRLAFIDERPVLSLQLPGRRWELLLRSGHEFRRQLASMRHIASGDAAKGELAIYRVVSHGNDHRNGASERQHGGSKVSTRIMAKMVAWLPRREYVDLSGVLRVRTSAESLLIAINAKDQRIWSTHADQLPRWVAAHRSQLQRWADDSKAEQRPVPSFTDRRSNAVTKYRHRINSIINETACQLVRYASRRKVATIEYDDTEQCYVERFPYYQLRNAIEIKANEYGIAFASGKVLLKTQESLER